MLFPPSHNGDRKPSINKSLLNDPGFVEFILLISMDRTFSLQERLDLYKTGLGDIIDRGSILLNGLLDFGVTTSSTVIRLSLFLVCRIKLAGSSSGEISLGFDVLGLLTDDFRLFTLGAGPTMHPYIDRDGSSSLKTTHIPISR